MRFEIEGAGRDGASKGEEKFTRASGLRPDSIEALRNISGITPVVSGADCKRTVKPMQIQREYFDLIFKTRVTKRPSRGEGQIVTRKCFSSQKQLLASSYNLLNSKLRFIKRLVILSVVRRGGRSRRTCSSGRSMLRNRLWLEARG